MLRKTYSAAASILVITLMATTNVTPAMAQAGADGGQGGATVNRANDDDWNAGWLGLIGLIGLAGLAGRGRANHRNGVGTSDRVATTR